MAAKTRLENLYSAIFASNQKVALKNEFLKNLKSEFFAEADILKQLHIGKHNFYNIIRTLFLRGTRFGSSLRNIK